MAILLLNKGETAADITVQLAEAGAAAESATVTDAWTGAARNVSKRIVADSVPPHGSYLAIVSGLARSI